MEKGRGRTSGRAEALCLSSPEAPFAPEVLYLEESHHSPVQFLDCNTLCSCVGSALSLWALDSGRRRLLSFSVEGDRRLEILAEDEGSETSPAHPSISAPAPPARRVTDRPSSAATAAAIAAEKSGGRVAAPGKLPSSAALSKDLKHRFPGVELRATEAARPRGRHQATASPYRDALDLLPCLATCPSRGLVACSGRVARRMPLPNEEEPTNCVKTFLLRRVTRKDKNDKNAPLDFCPQVTELQPDASPAAIDVVDLAFSACGTKLYRLSIALSQAQGARRDSGLLDEAAILGAPSLVVETSSAFLASTAEAEDVGKPEFRAAAHITVFDSTTGALQTRTKLHISDICECKRNGGPPTAQACACPTFCEANVASAVAFRG
ncbi:hypothetical protein BESB_028090 [Besnoitia besnoiti]|uniref:Uncharacterized protein n=1 Tax=Besnoitia besnoiti TaxID=94643 RepID=A0A2A9M2B6_BESBE|nr:uncharacterized protein BESB_028090 [Besnoitia besnoiti]PFH31374.1 hypothetical protein BESB_028090 [Besnoitia besnoiti]